MERLPAAYPLMGMEEGIQGKFSGKASGFPAAVFCPFHFESNPAEKNNPSPRGRASFHGVRAMQREGYQPYESEQKNNASGRFDCFGKSPSGFLSKKEVNYKHIFKKDRKKAVKPQFAIDKPSLLLYDNILHNLREKLQYSNQYSTPR